MNLRFAESIQFSLQISFHSFSANVIDLIGRIALIGYVDLILWYVTILYIAVLTNYTLTVFI